MANSWQLESGQEYDPEKFYAKVVRLSFAKYWREAVHNQAPDLSKAERG